MQRIKFTLLFCLIGISLFAQYVPTPGAPQSQPILLQGATAHLGNGEVIENAYIAFADGKITVAESNAVNINFKTHKIIDVSGKHVYPGLIAMNSSLGLTEIGLVRATRDDREVGILNPNVRSIIAYNTDSEVIPTIRSNGVLQAQIVPKGGRISGQSTLVGLDAWNWEDAAVALDEGVHLNWPRLYARTGWWAEPGTVKKNDKYAEQVREIETFFTEAEAYLRRAPSEDKNLKFEAVKGLFDGTKKLYIHTNGVKGIESGVLFAQKHGVQPVVVGGRDSWLVTDFLKENNVPVVLNTPHSLPQYEDSDIDQPFKTPALLEAAGVTWCFSHGSYWEQRNLPFVAGQAVGFGLDYEAAIKALTATPAAIAGAKNTGLIEVGKDATLIICEGDVLDMRTSIVTQAFYQGREVNLNNKHKMLNEKFGTKYKSE